MNTIGNIVGQARSYLTSGFPSGLLTGRSRTAPEAIFDHSNRVLKLALRLEQDLAMAESKIDDIVLTAAALFHDAGWVSLVKSDQIALSDVYSKPTDVDLLIKSAKIATEQLKDILSTRILDKIVSAITSMKTPSMDKPESILIADAENLEEFGVVGILQQVRQSQSTCKSNCQILDSWSRQQEYHSWDARIKSEFN